MRRAISVSILYLCVINTYLQAQNKKDLPPPNILWISWEDCGPQFGAYGDTYADTPHIDRLAEKGTAYNNAYANYPVCAPARATIITGMYPNSFGAQHMQCRTVPEVEVKLFPMLMRKAGYFCTNDFKDHYQMEYDKDIVWDRMGPCKWDENGYHGFWNERPRNKPFFSVVNFFETHEGNSRTNKSGQLEAMKKALGKRKHDPTKAPVPPYYPDNQIVRENIALYYDNLTYTDSLVGVILNQLEVEGLSENTIVFFWGDHGWGLPRGKRWPYQSGLKIPLVIYVPEKYKSWVGERYKPGQTSSNLVSFVDFAPTILSLAGVNVPEYMHGKPFLGPQAKPPTDIIFGGRDRMDETTDIMRFALTKDYLYIRNFQPQLPYIQTIRTMETQPIMKEWRNSYHKNKLNVVQALFFQKQKPVEELYDLRKDPHQINNLANHKSHQSILVDCRDKLKNWMLEIGDVGLIPEPEFDMLKWPEMTWLKTSAPYAHSDFRNYWNGDVELKLNCATPGADIVWKYENEQDWKIYSLPINARINRKIFSKANRLGYITSDIAVIDPSSYCEPAEEEKLSHWRTKVDKNLMAKLLEIKDLDLKGNDAHRDYFKYLEDQNPSIKYWAIEGIVNTANNSSRKQAAIKIIKPLLNDPSPTVRLKAATAFCEWGNAEEPKPVLVELLKHPHESVRLYAYNAIETLGADAAKLLPFPYIPPGTANHYSHRVLLRIYKRLNVDIGQLSYVDNDHYREVKNVFDSIILVEEL